MSCPRCGFDAGFEVTSLGSAQRQYICGSCGLGYVEVQFIEAPSRGPIEGPAIPTPDELLRAAGIEPQTLLPSR